MMSLPHNLEGGKWYTATKGGKVPYITREDCALAIAAALVGKPENKTYTLTGSTSYSIADVASAVTAITGRPLEVIDVTDEQLSGGLTGAGLPSFVVDMLVSADANIRAGNFDSLSGDFTTLTGKEPQTLRKFIEDRKAALTA